ncbi:Uncharacterised protein [Brucella abortus]|nr:Uncharacterised protein [Brucella abortus]
MRLFFRLFRQGAHLQKLGFMVAFFGKDAENGLDEIFIFVRF